MLDLAREVTGRRSLPGFSRPVVCDAELACGLRSLHELVMERSQEFDKEERLLLCLSLLLQRYGQPFEAMRPRMPGTRSKGPARSWSSTMPGAFVWTL